MDACNELLTEVERLEQEMPSLEGEGSRLLRSFVDRAGRPAALAASGGYARLADGVLRMAQHGIAPDALDR